MVISSVILILSIIRVWKSQAEFARPPIMLDMRIRWESWLSRYCHTAAGTQPQSGCGSLEQHLAPKTHEPRRSPPGLGADPAGFLYQTLMLDEPAKILFVQPHPRQCFDRALQLQQRERRRHQLENDRSILDLAAQPTDRGGEDPPMIGRHRYAKHQPVARQGQPPEIAPGFMDQACLVEQLVAFEDQLLVPRPGEGEAEPFRAQPPFRLARGLPRP